MNDTHEQYTDPRFDEDEHGYEPDKPESDNSDVDRAEHQDLDIDLDKTNEGDADLNIDLPEGGADREAA